MQALSVTCSTSAISRGVRVRLTYDGLVRGRTTTPQVDPARIDLRDGAAYLQAFSLDRRAWRTYRLDRIVAADPTGEPVDDHGPAPVPARQWFDDGRGDNTVTLALRPASRWITEYYPMADTPDHLVAPDGWELATFPVADPRWLTALLLRLGDDVRVVHPSGAQRDAVERAREALALMGRAAGRRRDEPAHWPSGLRPGAFLAGGRALAIVEVGASCAPPRTRVDIPAGEGVRSHGHPRP